MGKSALAGAQFQADATVTADSDGRFTLVLWIWTPENRGNRLVRADTCESLLEVAAFSIALAINPELRAEPGNLGATAPVEPAEQAPAQSAPEPSGSAPPLRAFPPRDTRPSEAKSVPLARSFAPPMRIGYRLGVQLVGDTSLLPAPSFGFRVSADILLFATLRLGLIGQAFLPQDERLRDGSGGHFSYWAIEGRACYQRSLAIAFAVCPMFQFGRVSGDGRGVTRTLSQHSPIYAPGATLLGSFQAFRRVSLVLSATGLFPVQRDTFVVNEGPVHKIPPVSLQFSFGVEIGAD